MSQSSLKIEIYQNFILNRIKYTITYFIEQMENDWLYEFQQYIKKFSILVILIVIILLIILFIF